MFPSPLGPVASGRDRLALHLQKTLALQVEGASTAPPGRFHPACCCLVIFKLLDSEHPGRFPRRAALGENRCPVSAFRDRSWPTVFPERSTPWEPARMLRIEQL